MNKIKDRPRAGRALAHRLGCALLAVWLLGMAAITLGSAQFIRARLADSSDALSQLAWRQGDLDKLEGRELRPGEREFSMNEAIARTKLRLFPPRDGNYPGEGWSPEVYRALILDLPVFVSFLDENNDVLRRSGDMIWFPYLQEETWTGEGEAAKADGFAWLPVDREDPAFDRLQVKYNGIRSLEDLLVVRVTGYPEENGGFFPLTMESISQGEYYHALAELVPGYQIPEFEDGTTQPPYTLGELDRMGELRWIMELDRSELKRGGQEPITIYGLHPQMFLYDAGGSFRYRGKPFPDLAALMEKFLPEGGQGMDANGSFFASQFDVTRCVQFRAWKESGGVTVVTATQESPLWVALVWLRQFYLISGVLTLAVFWLLNHSLQKNLVQPVKTVTAAMNGGWYLVKDYRETPPRWYEPWSLVQDYQAERERRQQAEDEAQRLQTALSFARSAEEKRKQNTSAVAHELKTPLSVVHSYAEGLREHIAEEKRDHYLEVILSETERMDAMVLSMLDLSRLEAGRVKLHREDFSLGDAAAEVMDKLTLAAQGKDLRFACSFPEDSVVFGDRERLRQVLENFLSNAVRYSDCGSEIRVAIRKDDRETSFSVENRCKPMEGEQLRRIWDTFYMTDEARQGPGTGLGLAIARNIVALHGGACHAENTDFGVKFSFTL